LTTDYQYRVVYRKRQQHWQKREDEQWKLFTTYSNRAGRPYTKRSSARAICSKEQNGYRGKTYEFKVQRMPLVDWEDDA
jgi:hypothetical protein